jgi:ribosomal protein L7/L12
MEDSDPANISQEAIDLAKQGRKIAAIKLIREQNGLGLAQAKDAIETYLRTQTREQAPVRSIPGAQIDIPRPAIAALENGHFIEAVRHTRLADDPGLKESKKLVEAFLAKHPSTQSKFLSMQSETMKSRVAKCLFVVTMLGLVAVAVSYVFRLSDK